ncbi:PadR family transcriptional regulator [uncultured Clostridium sp.]|uniref:PadR family transcriptional regulator n=1 Tax=uncultured Clostridium sp. TaxID=59620 RepID=UPI0028E8B678|nr:PadR family transcriptional regulator [uncultured Clostridium sp.]
MSEIQRTPMTEAMYYVLLALCEPLHGYAVMEEVKNISNGRVVMGPGTLYGILTRMEKEKLITLEESDGRRKIYALTSSGYEALKQEYLRLSKMVDDGKILFEKGDSHET